MIVRSNILSVQSIATEQNTYLLIVGIVVLNSTVRKVSSERFVSESLLYGIPYICL